MIYAGATLNVIDNTGILKARCIKVYGSTKKKSASIGEMILVVIENYTLKRGFLLDIKKKDRFMKGKKHKALIIRTKQFFKRNYGVFIKFSDNAIIIVNKRKLPLSKKLKGPILYETLEKYPSIGILAR
jgi:large subunit ribosomal protein L14